MIREGYGQIVHGTPPHILLNNASLVTKSCIARFVEGDASNSSALSDDKVDFACASGGEGPVLQSLSALELDASPSTNRAMHDFVTKLALLSKMWGSVSYTICPYPSRIITGSAGKAEKVPNFTKPTFPKKGVGKFSKKKIHFWNHQGVSFRVVWFVCFEPSYPFQRTVTVTSHMRHLLTKFHVFTTFLLKLGICP